MQNPYDINSNADAALMGGMSADSAAGFPTPQPRAGLRPTGSAILAESQARLAAMQAPAPKPPAEPMVGYNTQTKTIFSGGRTYEAGNLGSLAQAQQHGALDIAEQQFPEGYEPMPAAAVRQKLAAVPDWKKEMGSSLRNYGANMALVGGAVTGSQGMMDTYGRLNAESEALAQQSAAPKQWDDVEFGKNMLPYVRQLGIQSVPYIAEAMVTGFGLGSALKGVGVQAAKATAEKAILAEAAKLVAKTTVGGVARMSQEQALMQAASTVGNTFARSAGMAMGTYPSAVGDVLSNQMEQTGKIDGTSAALLGVPYAGLNLLGGTGLISGTGRAIERGLGTSVMGNAARAGTAAGITVGGEVVNEVGQEMLNQAGRIAVDPSASMFSPEATARYKESAIGGALLGGFGGAVAGAQGYMRPAEQAVTPQMLDQNDQAQLARYETDYAREGMVRDQAAGAGGVNFQGPMPGAPVKPEVVAPTAEEELAAQKLEDTFKAIGIGKGKKKRAIATEAVDAGIDLESETADQLVKLLKGNKLVAAQAELEKLKNDSTSGLSGAGDAGVGGVGGVEPAGGVDAGLPVADGGAGGTDPSAGEPAVGVQPPVAGGTTGLPTAPVKAVIPDFSLEAPSGAPSATYMEQNPSVEPEPAKQTDNLSLKNQKDTGQVPLFEPEVKRKRVLKAKDLTPTRAAVNVGGPVAPVQEERSEVVQAKQLKKTHEAMAAVEAAKTEEQRAAEAKQEAAEKTSIPPVEEFSKVYGDIAGRRAHAAASGETWASIAKREGVTEKAIRNMVNRLKGDKAGPEVRAALDIAQKKAVERRNKAAIASEGGDSSAVDVSAESEQVQELLAGEGMQVKSAESTGVKETEAEGGFSAKETKLLAQMDKLQKAIKEAKAEGDTATAARLKTELDVAAKRFAAEQEKYFVVTDETSTSEDTTEELGEDSGEPSWSDNEEDSYDSYSVGADKPAQEELDRVDAALRKIQGDFKAVLQYAIDNEANPARKATMEKVMARYVQLAKLGFDFSFAVTPVGRGYRNMQGLSTYTPGSLGSASKIKVELNGADWGANAGTSQETLAHELVHAVTQAAMYANPEGTAARELQEMYSAMRKDILARKAADKLTDFEKDFFAGKNNSLASANELLAWGLTNAKMQEYLASRISPDGKSWFHKLLGVVAKAIGIFKVDERSELAKLLVLSDNILSEDTAPYVATENTYGRSYGKQENTTKHSGFALIHKGRGEIAYDKDGLILIKTKSITGKDIFVPGKEGAGLAKVDVDTFSGNWIPAADLATLRKAAASLRTTVAPSVNSVTSKLPAPLQAAPKNIGETLRAFGQSALNVASFTEDLIARAVTKGIKSAKDYDIAQKLRASKAGERERAAIKVMEPFNDLSTAQQKAANEYLYESTRSGKWGYDPKIGGKSAVVDPGMQGKFNALTPGAQAFVRSVFNHGVTTLADKKAMVNKVVADEFAADLKEANASKNARAVAQLEEAKKSMLARFQTLFALSEGSPYAPLRRDGEWLVVGTSKEYAAASPEEQKAMQTDADHYHVSFTDTEGEARAAAKELESEGMVTHYRPKEAMLEEMYGGKGVLGALFKIKHQVEQAGTEAKTEAEQQSLNQLRRMVTGMYLNALGESSARKSEMRRKGIAGNIDMVRGFGLQAQADAQFMASVEFNKQIMDAIGGMRKESTTGENQQEKMKLFNELMRRQVETVAGKEQKLSDRMTRATSLWMLATSPAYYLTNATQPFVMSVPYMAKNHSYAAAASAMTKAWAEVAGLVKATKWNHTLDLSNTPADARTAMENLAKLGIIDIGMSSEMGSFQVADRNQFTKAWNRVDDTLRVLSQKLEAINRLSTGVAAYRLELARTGDKAAAEAYAGKVITQTHGDYSRANAPRAFNSGLGRVALQFRKFQLIQITLISKLVKEAFAGATAEERTAARRGLGFVFAHMGVLGGMVALPGYAVWSAVAAALLGDDGPEDLEQQMRKVIGNQAIADLLIRGVPAAAGVDVSGRIGMSTMLSILPFTDVDFSSRKSVTDIGFALTLGATGGLALRGADALKHMKQGDYYRGVESAMPSGIMNAMKAARFAGEGIVNSKGELLTRSEDEGTAKTLVRALGFTTTADTRRTTVTSRQYNEDEYFRERVNILKRQYREAVRDGKSPSNIISDWKAMQDNQRARGIVVTPLGQLYRAPMQSAKNERNTVEGVQFRRANQESVKADTRT